LGIGKDAGRGLERSAVTSAVAFARDHASIWRSLTPTAEIFVRRLNADLYEREYAPLKSAVEPDRRALVNEIAFRLFSMAITEKWQGRSVADQAIEQARNDVQRASEKFYGAASAQTMGLNKSETEEVLNLFERLRRFFTRASERQGIELSPRFVGCGILDTCAGDIYFPTTLFEVKAGDRSFRSIDVRQLLIYAALNKASGARELTQIGLFNPRTGVSFVAGLDDLCLDISGRPSGDLLTEIIRMVSSGDVSR
jgi:hypothetical protein